MLLAARILSEVADDEIRNCLRIPESYFLGSDVMYTFMSVNNLMHWNDQKYKSEAQIRAEYPQIQREYLAGEFPPDILEELKNLLETLGPQPLIVRSSSLLEDSYGTSFAGKYDSFFCPNQGTPAENLTALTEAIATFGPDQPVAFPNTAYYLPVIRCLSGEAVTKLGELVPILNRMRNQVKPELTFANARLWGESTLYAAEIIEAIHYREKDEPKVEPWSGYLSDPILRKYGIKLVDWTIPGQAVIIGRARTSKDAAKIVEELMGAGMMIFACDEFIEQLLSAPDETARRRLLEENKELITQELLDTLTNIAAQINAGQDRELAEQINALHRTVLRYSMQIKLSQ